MKNGGENGRADLDGAEDIRGNQTARQKKSNKKALFLKTFSISILVFAFIATAGLYLAMRMAKPPEIPAPDLSDIAYYPLKAHEDDRNIGNGVIVPENFTVSDRKEAFYTFVVFGIDVGANTDTLIVASYDGKNDEAHMVHIPRDSLVNVSRSIKKINAAYGAGTLNGGGREGGVSQLKRELKTIIGFAPDFYISVNMNAFIRVVDAVGGVEVTVPFHMLYDDPDQDLHINLPAGTRTLTGREALHFARYRTGNDPNRTISDYRRIEHQQQVIKEVISRLLRPANLLKIPEFIEIFNTNVFHNLKAEDILWFANEFKGISGLDILQTHVLPTLDSVRYNVVYEILDEEGVLELVNATINPYIKDIEAKDLDIITKFN